MANRKVGVVINVRASADNPINKTRPDQWDNASAAQPGRRQSSRQTHPHCHICSKHLLGKKMARLTKATCIVGLEVVIHQRADINALWYRGSRNLVTA